MRAVVTHVEDITFDGQPACRTVCKLEASSPGEPFRGRLVIEGPCGPKVDEVFELLLEPARVPIPIEPAPEPPAPEPTTEKVPADRGGKGEK